MFILFCKKVNTDLFQPVVKQICYLYSIFSGLYFHFIHLEVANW